MDPTNPTLENLLSLVAELLVCEPDDIDQQAGFLALGINSLDHIQLIGDVEEHFEIALTDEESEAATTVDALYQIILSKYL